MQKIGIHPPPASWGRGLYIYPWCWSQNVEFNPLPLFKRHSGHKSTCFEAVVWVPV